MILQWGSTIKVSLELPVTTRHHHDMTEKLLIATFNPNKQHQHETCFTVFLQAPHNTVYYTMTAAAVSPNGLTYFEIRNDQNTGKIYVRYPLYEDQTDRMTYEVWAYFMIFFLIFCVFGCCFFISIKWSGSWKYRNDLKFSDRYAWANSADPDRPRCRWNGKQYRPWSGSILFAIPSASFRLITVW